MVWPPFATLPERADTTEAADLNRSRLHSTRRSLFAAHKAANPTGESPVMVNNDETIQL
jgi:hypothetical protein